MSKKNDFLKGAVSIMNLFPSIERRSFVAEEKTPRESIHECWKQTGDYLRSAMGSYEPLSEEQLRQLTEERLRQLEEQLSELKEQLRQLKE